jgi:hypothetical protein
VVRNTESVAKARKHKASSATTTVLWAHECQLEDDIRPQS